MQNLLPNNVLVRKIPLDSSAKSNELLFIQAAGRAISGKNAGRIKEAWATLTNLLVEHEWLDKNYLMPEKKAEESVDSPEILAADKKTAGTSSVFLKSVQVQTWIESLRIALYRFGSEFQDLLDATPERLGMLTRRSTLSRDELVSALIDDLKTFLEGHAIACPEMGANGGGLPPHHSENYYGADRAIRSSEKPGAEEVSETTSLQAAMFGEKSLKDTIDQLSWKDRLATTLRVFSWQFHGACCLDDDDDDNELETEAEEAAERQLAASGLIKDLLDVLNQLCKDHPAIGSGSSPYASLQLSASDVDSQKVEIELSAFQVVLADESSEEVNLNRHPVEGILFRVDEASEGIPSIGPGLPLYIPSSVAHECLSQVSGLPLDAHDTLTKHAQEEPTGVMLSASISGKDFCIKGLLWPWNKADKVTAIKAAKGSLGMSMNAAAIGHEVTLNAGTSNAQKVFWITKLILLGANILYAARATYKQTRLSAEEKEAAPSAWDLSQVDGDEAGCIRWMEADEVKFDGEEAPTPDSEGKICLLDVPPGKNGRAFTKAVDAIVGKAIQAWEDVRPQQAPFIDRRTGEEVHYLFAWRSHRLGDPYLNKTLIPLLCDKAGVPEEDVRGKITSHRARHTIFTQLSEFMTIPQLQSWSGHKSTNSLMHYLKSTLSKQAAAYQKTDYFKRNLRTFEVLIDQEAITNGAAARGEPWKYHKLGDDGYCVYDFFDQCLHKMACPRCPFYHPNSIVLQKLQQNKTSWQKMLIEIELTEDERSVVEEEVQSLERLCEKLVDIKTPGGITPRQLKGIPSV